MVHFDLGVALYLKGLQNEAREEFKLYSRFNPASHLEIGQFLYEKGQFSEAITSFREAAKFEPAPHQCASPTWHRPPGEPATR